MITTSERAARFGEESELDWVILATIAYASLMVLPFWGSPRFRFPVEPLIILAACKSVWLWPGLAGMGDGKGHPLC